MSSLVNRDITDTIIKMTRLLSIKDQTVCLGPLHDKDEAAKNDTKSEVSWNYPRNNRIVEGQFQVANPAVTTCLSTTSTDSKILYIDDDIESMTNSEQVSGLDEDLNDPNEIIDINNVTENVQTESIEGKFEFLLIFL